MPQEEGQMLRNQPLPILRQARFGLHYSWTMPQEGVPSQVSTFILILSWLSPKLSKRDSRVEELESRLAQYENVDKNTSTNTQGKFLLTLDLIYGN